MPDLSGRLEEDARLSDALRFPAGSTTELDQVLLTGVTGFLGGELLRSLLGSTRARIHCLVRGKTGCSARERWEPIKQRVRADASRVVLVEGDLAESALGDPELEHRIDTVVHCAAAVNLFAPYTALRASNVLAARNVLDFAARGSAKAVHFVSTVGVFLSPEYRGRTVFEDEVVRGEEGLRNGYAQSKWVADTMMARARSRGARVSVYRPAFVGWHSETGYPGEHDLVARLLHSSLEAGCAPRLDLQINSTPVDQVADTIAKLVGSRAARGGTYHVVNGTAARFVDVARMAGLRLVELPEWTAIVARKAPRFAKLAALVHASQSDEESGSVELRFEHNRTYDATRLRETLGPPYPTHAALDAGYVSRFTQALFPSEKRSSA